MIDNSIHEEYEKIFGASQKPVNLFDTDEEYDSIRQYIVGAKVSYNIKKSLPFYGIKLYTYDVFQIRKVAMSAENAGYRIFYLKERKNRKFVAYAAAYHNPVSGKFNILKGSFFMNSEFFKNQMSHLTTIEKNCLLSNFCIENDIIYLKYQTSDISASLFASFVLGKKVSFREWKDNRSRTLDAYYPKYNAVNIDEKEDKTFPEYARCLKVKKEKSPFEVGDVNEYNVANLIVSIGQHSNVANLIETIRLHLLKFDF